MQICFSLSDWLYSIWQFLGPSTSLQMAQFHSFLWPSNVVCLYHRFSIHSASFVSGDCGKAAVWCSELSASLWTWMSIEGTSRARAVGSTMDFSRGCPCWPCYPAPSSRKSLHFLRCVPWLLFKWLALLTGKSEFCCLSVIYSPVNT